MAIKDILKNLNLFIDGVGYAGQISEYTPPALTLATEDYRAGGMDAPVAIDMGMEALDITFTLNAYSKDILTTIGDSTKDVAFTIRGALEDYHGSVTPVMHSATGKVTSIARSSWSAGTLPTVEVTARLVYYKEVINKETVVEIDVLNMKRIINGVDRLASIRSALGV